MDDWVEVIVLVVEGIVEIKKSRFILFEFVKWLGYVY